MGNFQFVWVSKALLESYLQFGGPSCHGRIHAMRWTKYRQCSVGGKRKILQKQRPNPYMLASISLMD